MDHKVSKDMISSGMIPSGEKTQADLGRTQYGSAPSPSRLMDAYHSMYQNQKEETVDEMAGPIKIRNKFKKKKALDQIKNKQQPNRGGDEGSGVYDATASGKVSTPMNEIDKPSVSGPDQGQPMQGKVKVRKVDPRTLKNNPRGDIQTNSFDLLAAYQSMYIDSFEEGKIPAGLQAYLDKKKGKKKE